MQTPHRLHTTPHRRQRLVLWAIAMLSWIAAVLFAGKQITYRQLKRRRTRVSLERLRRLTINLLIVRAAELARTRRRGHARYWKHGRDLHPRHLIRTLIGSRLRHTLRQKDVAAHIASLIRALRNLDAYAALLASRMKRRLTRLGAITPARAASEPLLGPPASLVRRGLGEGGLPALADSS